jgi:hypothetical protein
MSEYQSLTTEELEEKKEWYLENGWGLNAESVEAELSKRQEEDISKEERLAKVSRAKLSGGDDLSYAELLSEATLSESVELDSPDTTTEVHVGGWEQLGD